MEECAITRWRSEPQQRVAEMLSALTCSSAVLIGWGGVRWGTRSVRVCTGFKDDSVRTMSGKDVLSLPVPEIQDAMASTKAADMRMLNGQLVGRLTRGCNRVGRDS